MLETPTATLPQTFTFAPTFVIAPAANFSTAAKIDKLQNAFNMALLDGAHRSALLPISDGLYDVFCLYEQADPEADRLLAGLIAQISTHPLNDLAAMTEVRFALADLLEGEPEF
jgi:hypothetical protein